MTYNDILSQDLKDAMRAKDKVKLKAVRGLKAKVKEREIDKGDTLTENEWIKIVQSAVKQRKDAIELFEKGGRADLVQAEGEELAILEKYLPEMMSNDDILIMVKRIINETGAKTMKDIGKVMPKVMAESKGLADGKVVQQLVKEELT